MCSTAFQTALALPMRGFETSPLVTGTESVDVSIPETLWRLWLFLCEAFFLKTGQIFGSCNVHISCKSMFKTEKSLLDLSVNYNLILESEESLLIWNEVAELQMLTENILLGFKAFSLFLVQVTFSSQVVHICP